MRNHFQGIPRKIYNFRRNRPRNLREQICNRREQVVRAGCKLLRANCQSKYQHCGGSLQSCAEKNIRFDCKSTMAFSYTATLSSSCALHCLIASTSSPCSNFLRFYIKLVDFFYLSFQGLALSLQGR